MLLSRRALLAGAAVLFASPLSLHSQPAARPDSRRLFFTVWTTTVEQVREYAPLIKKLGFDGVDFVVTWNRFEPQEGVFDWTYVDQCLDIFTSYGLKLSLSAMFWPSDLAWAQSLEMQRDQSGAIYRYEELTGNPADRHGSNLCFNDARNLAIIARSLRAFARHTHQKYGRFVARYHARTSHFGELEYTPGVPLDFSPISLAAFRDYLRESYGRNGGLEVFNRNYELKLTAWQALENVPVAALLARSSFDWQGFRLQTLREVIRVTSRALKAGAPGKLVALQVGSLWDESAARLRATFDPFLISRDIDILHTDDSHGWPHAFSFDLQTSLAPDRLHATEINGITSPDTSALAQDFERQARSGGGASLTFLNTANWQPAQMREWEAVL